MYETTDSNALVDANYTPARELTNDYLKTYAIEDESQANAYRRLAYLVKEVDDEGGLILSVNVSYEQDDVDFYNIVVTVSV